MSNTLNHTIETAKSMRDSANEGADRAVEKVKHTVGSVREGAEHAASSARTTWLDRVKIATEIVTILRGFRAEDALRWVGLARRRSLLLPIGTFGAGIVVGASAGLLFAPMSGAETRRLIVGRIAGLKHRVGSTLEGPTPGVGRVGEQAEANAGKAKESVIDAEDNGNGVKPDHVDPDAPINLGPKNAATPNNGHGDGNRQA